MKIKNITLGLFVVLLNGCAGDESIGPSSSTNNSSVAAEDSNDSAADSSGGTANSSGSTPEVSPIAYIPPPPITYIPTSPNNTVPNLQIRQVTSVTNWNNCNNPETQFSIGQFSNQNSYEKEIFVRSINPTFSNSNYLISSLYLGFFYHNSSQLYQINFNLPEYNGGIAGIVIPGNTNNYDVRAYLNVNSRGGRLFDPNPQTINLAFEFYKSIEDAGRYYDPTKKIGVSTVVLNTSVCGVASLSKVCEVSYNSGSAQVGLNTESECLSYCNLQKSGWSTNQGYVASSFMCKYEGNALSL